MSIIVIYVVTAVVFLVVDAAWLKWVAGPMFHREVGPLLREEVRFDVAGGFYVLYVAGVVFLAGLPGLEHGVGHAALMGFVVGGLAYGTYESTNMATLKGWTWGMVLSDTIWGAALTAVSVAAGVWVALRLGLA